MSILAMCFLFSPSWFAKELRTSFALLQCRSPMILPSHLMLFAGLNRVSLLLRGERFQSKVLPIRGLMATKSMLAAKNIPISYPQPFTDRVFLPFAFALLQHHLTHCRLFYSQHKIRTAGMWSQRAGIVNNLEIRILTLLSRRGVHL
jgi:hypothetical protein